VCWVVLSCNVSVKGRSIKYVGKCAHCGAGPNSRRFLARRQGFPIAHDFCLGLGTADHLRFPLIDPKNDRLCCKCERKGRDEAVEANKCSLDLLLICVNILHLERGCIFVLLCSLAVICHRHSGGPICFAYRFSTIFVGTFSVGFAFCRLVPRCLPNGAMCFQVMWLSVTASRRYEIRPHDFSLFFFLLVLGRSQA
jgi:hypothetical protein